MAVHLIIKHITFVLTILTFMAILMISYHVYSDNIKHGKPEYRLFAIIIICRWLSRASDFVPCIRDIFFVVSATDHTVHHHQHHERMVSHLQHPYRNHDHLNHHDNQGVPEGRPERYLVDPSCTQIGSWEPIIIHVLMTMMMLMITLLMMMMLVMMLMMILFMMLLMMLLLTMMMTTWPVLQWQHPGLPRQAGPPLPPAHCTSS